VDNGVSHVGGEVSIGRVIGIGMFLGPLDFGSILHGTKTHRGSRTAGGILAGTVRGFSATAFSVPREGFFPDGSALWCKAPSWSKMQEMDPKWKISLGLKAIIVLKVIAMESSFINVTPYLALAVGVCDPIAHHEVTCVMLLGRTTTLIMTRWFVS
jgi:hypothetical protein